MDETLDDLTNLGQETLTWITTYAPSVLWAIVLLAVGWLLGRVLSRVTSRLIDRVLPGLDKRTRMAVTPLGIQRRLADVIGTFVFWAVFVIFGGAAANVVGLPVLASWLSQAVSFLPRILLGGLIFMGGLVLGTLVRDAIVTATSAAGLSSSNLLARFAQVAIVTAAAVAGVEQIGIDSQFVTAALTVTIAAALGGAALAFALGARTDVSNIVGMHYVRQSYRVGQRISVSEVTGRVRELTTAAVVLETDAEHVRVPGKLFSEQVSRVLTADDERQP